MLTAMAGQGRAWSSGPSEQLNILHGGVISYPWALYSIGNGASRGGSALKCVDEPGFTIGDSGGFQIRSGAWRADWRAGSGDPRAERYRERSLGWMTEHNRYGMCLDIPTGTLQHPRGRAASQITTYEQCLAATRYNNDWFRDNNQGLRILNILQGHSEQESHDWYQAVKDYNDPGQRRPYRGWAFGGRAGFDLALMLGRLWDMRRDGGLENAEVIHTLGLAGPRIMAALTIIQQAMKQRWGHDIVFTHDSNSPFRAAMGTDQLANPTPGNQSDHWGIRYHSVNDINGKHWAQCQDPILTTLAKIAGEPVAGSPVLDRCRTNDLAVLDDAFRFPDGRVPSGSFDVTSFQILGIHNLWHFLPMCWRRADQALAGEVPEHGRDPFTGRDIWTVIHAVFDAPDHTRARQIIADNQRLLSSFVRRRQPKALSTFDQLFSIQE